jgi:hypothetical protein
MAITKKDLSRIAAGFKYIAGDPTADHSTVIKMITEFDNAVDSLYREISNTRRHDRAAFHSAIFGGGRAVTDIYSGKRRNCGACDYDLFYDKGRSLDYNYHECQRCFHPTQSLTETGASA